MNSDDLHGRKRRSEFSREKFLVKSRHGPRYVLKASDGSVITKSRFELIKADDADPLGTSFDQINHEYTGILHTKNGITAT